MAIGKTMLGDWSSKQTDQRRAQYRDVDAALHQIVETVGGLSKEAAVDFIKKLKADKRYQRDVY